MNEFADGGLHPGYAFPLWHGVPRARREGRLRRPGGGRAARGDRARAAGRARRLRGGLRALPAGRAGASRSPARSVGDRGAWRPGTAARYTALALPATASRQLLVPAALALAFTCVRAPTRGAARLDARRRRARARRRPPDLRDLPLDPVRRLPRRPLGLAVRAAARAAPSRSRRSSCRPAVPRLAPARRAEHGVASAPTRDERARGFAHYAGQLDGSARPLLARARRSSGARARSRSPRCCWSRSPRSRSRRRWAAYVLGGSLAVFAITLVPWLFTPFSDVVSLSQARRLAGFLPFAFALAGGMGGAGGAARRVRAAARARRRDRPAVALPRRLRLRARRGRAGAGRPGSRSPARSFALVLGFWRLRSRARRRPPSPRRSLLLPDVRPRPLRLVAVRGPAAEPAHARRSSSAAHDVPAGGDRLLRPRVELPDRRRRARLRLQRAAGPRRRHDAEPPVRAPRPWRRFNRTGDLGDPARAAARGGS